MMLFSGCTDNSATSSDADSSFIIAAQITSVNTTAACFKNDIDTFLTECDTKGYGMKMGNDSTATITIQIDSTGWQTTIDNTHNFKSLSNGPNWLISGARMTTDDSVVEQKNIPQNLLSVKLMRIYPDIKQGVAIAWVKGAKVEAVIFTHNTTTVADIGNVASAKYDGSGVLSGTDVDWAARTCKWDGKTAGISDKGLMVGTAPVLSLG